MLFYCVKKTYKNRFRLRKQKRICRKYIMVSGDFDKKEYQKMVFIMNALNDGWSVKKNQDTYIFKKKHENKVEIFQEDYLATFIVNNMCLNNPALSK